MEAKCIAISELTNKAFDWITKLQLIEKGPLRFNREGTKGYQKYMFRDNAKNTIQAIAYFKDMYVLDELLQLYNTYYIANAKIELISIKRYKFAMSEYQLTLSRSTFVKPVPEKCQLPLDDCYDFTPFRDFYIHVDDDNDKINILGVAVTSLPRRTVPRGAARVPIQEFVIVNQECRPVVLTLWTEFLDVEAVELMNSLHDYPAVIITRAKVNSYHVVGLETDSTSMIICNPQIPQALILKEWVQNNRAYIEQIMAERLYDRGHQQIEAPLGSQIRLLGHIQTMQYIRRPFWIRGQARIIIPQRRLYVLTCPASNCKRQTGAPHGFEFTCNHCRKTFSQPCPRLRFLVEIYDHTDTITAMIEHEHAYLLLEIPAEEVMQLTLRNEEPDLVDINTTLATKAFYFQVRKFTTDAGAGLTIRYNVTACLPSTTAALMVPPREDIPEASETLSTGSDTVDAFKSEDSSRRASKRAAPTDSEVAKRQKSL